MYGLFKAKINSNSKNRWIRIYLLSETVTLVELERGFVVNLKVVFCSSGNAANSAHEIQDPTTCGIVWRKEIAISQYPTLTMRTILHVLRSCYSAVSE